MIWNMLFWKHGDYKTKQKHLNYPYLEDLSDYITENIDEKFWTKIDRTTGEEVLIHLTSYIKTPIRKNFVDNFTLEIFR